ncbi:CRISPR/Cas system-associated endoribonuclease Cas2 [Pseudomonas pohangensis]|uniref:CRISPR-associated endoribonuclease Cas2 n=1 Tax=Pseudomonas pohangensis TaxID=364197 RepID=A0A1H2G0Z2_9PSED|nr:CRISPR-associated endonuclease Cas2 [Pseudomonas pohangensis]SDU13256.1 CRISPR/Cas system-associated endoribonuclease Cas2 [Pseudomonas pohangensis]
MNNSAWYVISYDIHNVRRLTRTYRLLRQQAHPLLESLFVFQGSPQQLQQLRQQLAERLNTHEDDLLIYRLRHDRPVHRWGTACLPSGLYDFTLPALIEHRDERLPDAHNWSNFTQLYDQKTISLFELSIG